MSDARSVSSNGTASGREPSVAYIFDHEDTEALIKKGFTWAVVAQYAHAGYERAEIISKHRSYNAANRAAGGHYGSFRSIIDLHYAN
jgi:hypothetical protein